MAPPYPLILSAQKALNEPCHTYTHPEAWFAYIQAYVGPHDNAFQRAILRQGAQELANQLIRQADGASLAQLGHAWETAEPIHGKSPSHPISDCLAEVAKVVLNNVGRDPTAGLAMALRQPAFCALLRRSAVSLDIAIVRKAVTTASGFAVVAQVGASFSAQTRTRLFREITQSSSPDFELLLDRLRLLHGEVPTDEGLAHWVGLTTQVHALHGAATDTAERVLALATPELRPSFWAEILPTLMNQAEALSQDRPDRFFTMLDQALPQAADRVTQAACLERWGATALPRTLAAQRQAHLADYPARSRPRPRAPPVAQIRLRARERDPAAGPASAGRAPTAFAPAGTAGPWTA